VASMARGLGRTPGKSCLAELAFFPEMRDGTTGGRYVGIAGRGVERAVRLVQRILDFYRPESKIRALVMALAYTAGAKPTKVRRSR
jgi:signal transduction histidine kinase